MFGKIPKHNTPERSRFSKVLKKAKIQILLKRYLLIRKMHRSLAVYGH